MRTKAFTFHSPVSDFSLISYSAVHREATVTYYLKYEQLLLFAFLRCSIIVSAPPLMDPQPWRGPAWGGDGTITEHDGRSRQFTL